MNFDKPTFLSAIDSGRSLIWVPSEAHQQGIGGMLATMVNTLDFIIALPAAFHWGQFAESWAAPLPPGQARIALVVPPTMTHGVRLPADRVIWIAENSDKPLDAMYRQAMARCDYPDFQPTKIHYTANQVLRAY